MTEGPDTSMRRSLPIPDIPAPGLTTYDAKDPDTYVPADRAAAAAGGRAERADRPARRRRASARRARSAARASTPTAERLAAGGLKYNRFHTTALCSPTRAALLTGRNHHSVGMGSITEIATSAPGYSSMRPEHGGAAGRDAEAERLLDRAVRQVPRGAGVGDAARWARSTRGRPAVAASSTSTGSSAARPTSGTRRSTRARRRSSRRRRRRRATTSPRT